eukprot:scaffold16691_cov74-Phaeocystis_antarctica.AAC.6
MQATHGHGACWGAAAHRFPSARTACLPGERRSAARVPRVRVQAVERAAHTDQVQHRAQVRDAQAPRGCALGRLCPVRRG